MIKVLMIGGGAIGRVVMRYVANDPNLRITQVLDQASARESLQAALGPSIKVISSLDEMTERPDYVMECAGHAAVKTHVPALLERGIDVALVSVGSLAEPGLAESLEQAAVRGGAQLHLISGAIAGIDAIASAKVAGLDEVIYTGRKPPIGWMGTPAERVCDLANLKSAQVIFEGSAGEAARLYPKNANVAATVSLAGLGLDRTRATLIADPGVTKNIHEVLARGAFGELKIQISGNPLPENPKTSALAAYCAVRVLRNRAAALVI
ncbi:MAG: aspartate dehydrogenase [Burkholderiales bacterium]